MPRPPKKNLYQRLQEKAIREHWELNFLRDVRAMRIPEPQRNFVFARDLGRQWALDFAWPEQMVAVEIEGGTKEAPWRTRGRHVREAGFQEDCFKYNSAVQCGWHLYRFTSDMVKSGHAANFMREILMPPPPIPLGPPIRIFKGGVL